MLNFSITRPIITGGDKILFSDSNTGKEPIRLIIRQSFKISFQNAELWNGCFDGLEDSYDLIRTKFLEDIDVIKRPSSPSLILLNLNGTTVTYDLGSFMMEHLISIQSHIRKVAIAGLNFKSRGHIRKYIKTSDMDPQFLIGYFDDLQKAKEWLV